MAHEHVPLYRVARAGWADPLDTDHSRLASNRWNSRGGHRVLYTACSLAVARCIVADVFALGAFGVEDLQPEYFPVLAEVNWAGEAVDLASPTGLVEAGFPLDYPDRIEHHHTQPFAAAWFTLGAEGVLCRSASVFRINHRGWVGPHENWAELAIFVENAKETPVLVRVRPDDEWLNAVT